MGGNLLPRTESREMGERLVPYVTGTPNAMLGPAAPAARVYILYERLASA